jgi:alcohol dehydrogenase
MKAWILDRAASRFSLEDVPPPTLRAGGALVQMEAVPLLSYTRTYLEGKLPYAYPDVPFTPGTNGVGRVLATGEDLHHLRVGQRVAVNPYWIAHENVTEPAQILIGLTAISADSARLQAAYPHGTLREIGDFPAATLVSLDGLEQLSSERLSALGKFAVPYGGLRRGRLLAGETVVINGAAGYFGSAAVLLALAMGAAKVVALARQPQALARLVDLGKGRVVPVALSGNAAADASTVRTALHCGADLAFDMVGQATDPSSTLAALKSLRRGGRLVLMGSMTVDLPLSYSEVMLNNWEIIGNFMYRQEDFLSLVNLVRAGLLSLDQVEMRSFALDNLQQAIDHAGNMQGLASTTVLLT